MKKILDFFKKKPVIIISIFLLSIILLYLIIYFFLFFNLSINGKSKLDISYNDLYKEQGVTFKLFGSDLSNKVNIKSNVINGKVGNYKVIYSYSFLIFNIKKERKVNIIDNISPIITLSGENSIIMCPNSIYEDEGFNAYDEYDGDLTNKVNVQQLEDEIIYEVSDSSGNKEKVHRLLIREDKEAPSITLKGSGTTYIRYGNTYNEYGYEVSDNCDLEPKVEISGDVDTSKEGTYTLTYTVTDSSGNVTTIERKIIVYVDNRIGLVYLTFDDGPSGSGTTEQILNILKEEGVKATFFVTGYGPDSLIKREYDEGHKIALHTYTHEYSDVYSSVDNYYNDLNKISDRVYNITGQRSNIIRFPGGSNNTVSNRYSYGIMNILTRDVTEKGYIYFDWNVSAEDAGGCSTSDCVYNGVVNYLSKDRVNVVLMHDVKWHTANALKDIITYCKQNGFVFDVLSESTYQVKFK